MMLLIVPIIFMTIGFLFIFMARMIPILNMVLFPEFGGIFTCAASIFLMYRLYVADTFKQTDKLGKSKHLINYMRRDAHIVPIYGQRAYPGESFIDVEGLGLVEFLGKDCFYNWGDKKVIWGLENINFTPDPRYFNLCHLFWEVGFTDSVDIYNVLNGLDLELMGRVYLNMLEYDQSHGVNRLVNSLKEYDGEIVKFEPVTEAKVDKVHTKIDNLLNKHKGTPVKKQGSLLKGKK